MSDETLSPDTPKRTRADIARANGAKSKGPITPEGKAISSRNSFRHGLRSKQVVLAYESDESYRALLRSYVEQFRPQNSVELDLVGSMAVARWRLGRLVSIETNILGIHLAKFRNQIPRSIENENPDNDQRIAWAFNSMSGGTGLSLVAPYESSLNRSFDRALKQLHAIRAQPTKNINVRTQNSDSQV